MEKYFFLVAFLILRIPLAAQENDLVNCPYREITVSCGTGQKLPFDGYPMCYFIQTRDEFNNLCGGKKSEVNFFREIVLGVWVEAEGTHTKIGTKPDFHYRLMHDKHTKEVHFFVYYSLNKKTKNGKMTALTWIAIPKPMGNYQVHFHLKNRNEIETRTFKNTQ